MICSLTYPEKVFACVHYRYKISALVVNFHYNVERIYILQQINVHICICIKGIKTTVRIFFQFLWTIHEAELGNDCLVHFFSQSLWHLSLYSFSEESCSEGCLSVSVVSFSQSYISSKAIVEPNSLCQDHATTKTWPWFCREKKSQYLSVYAYPYVSLCFICTSNQVTIVLPLGRHLLQVFITTVK